MTKPKIDGFKKGDEHKKPQIFAKKENESWKKKQIERMKLLTEEKSERMRSNDAEVERMDLWQRWRTRSDNVFSLKSREMRERVVVFIGEVHGRRSNASIQDKNQPNDDTCRAP